MLKTCLKHIKALKKKSPLLTFPQVIRYLKIDKENKQYDINIDYLGIIIFRKSSSN